jgi:hypothetical protein
VIEAEQTSNLADLIEVVWARDPSAHVLERFGAPLIQDDSKLWLQKWLPVLRRKIRKLRAFVYGHSAAKDGKQERRTGGRSVGNLSRCGQHDVDGREAIGGELARVALMEHQVSFYIRDDE